MAVKLIPKYVNLNCTLRVVHDHLLGWDSLTGNYLNNSIDMKCFHYGIPVVDAPDGGSEIITDSFNRSNSDTINLAASANTDTSRGTAHGNMLRTDIQYWKGWSPSADGPLMQTPA